MGRGGEGVQTPLDTPTPPDPLVYANFIKNTDIKGNGVEV